MKSAPFCYNVLKFYRENQAWFSIPVHKAGLHHRTPPSSGGQHHRPPRHRQTRPPAPAAAAPLMTAAGCCHLPARLASPLLSIGQQVWTTAAIGAHQNTADTIATDQAPLVWNCVFFNNKWWYVQQKCPLCDCVRGTTSSTVFNF